MSSLERTLAKLLLDVRGEIANSTPLPPWTVLVVERAKPEEIEAAAKSFAEVRRALPVLKTIKRGRKLTALQRRAQATFKEHDPACRAFAERYGLRVTESGVWECDLPWRGDLEAERPYHVADRIAEPAESGGVVLWTVVHPGDVSEEERALAEAAEARRLRMVEGRAEPSDEVAPPQGVESERAPVEVAPAEPAPGEERQAMWADAKKKLMSDMRRPTGKRRDRELEDAIRQRRTRTAVLPLFLGARDRRR